MLKELIQEKGVSVYVVARECGLPYTTVNELVLEKKSPQACSYKTIAALAAYFRLSPEDLMARLTEAQLCPPAVNPTWEQAKKQRYRFPVKYPADSYDASRIHPLKQRAVQAVVASIRDTAAVRSLTLFGSAPTICCNSHSDLDLAVELQPEAVNTEVKNNISERIQEACNYGADIIWMDRVDRESQLYRNICRGVKLK